MEKKLKYENFLLLKNVDDLKSNKQTPKSGSKSVTANSQYADPNMSRVSQKQLMYPDASQGVVPALYGPGGVMPNNGAYYNQQQSNPGQIYGKAVGAMQPSGGQGYYINEQDDGQLPPPPPPQLTHHHHAASVEIYAESNRLNNGTRSSKINVQQAGVRPIGSGHYAPGMMGERPHLPPPPVPNSGDGHLSDLQQIQQQIIRKFDGLSMVGHGSLDGAANSGDGTAAQMHPVDHGADLPPPPPMQLDANGGHNY